LILLTVYRPYQRMSLDFVDWATSSNRNMVLFMITIFVIPLLLMGLG